MMLNDYFAESVKHVAVKAAEFIEENFGAVRQSDIVTKDLNSLVSYVDVGAEKIIIEGLSKILPDSTFLAEEGGGGEQTEGDVRWIVDPLDGTTNFLHQIPVFAVSIALQVKGEIVFGLVYEVNRKECFHAIKGKGAFLNNEPIKPKEPELSDAMIATGFPYYDFSKAEEYLRVINDIIRSTRGLRRMGAAAVDLAYVACGRFDGFFEYSLSPWDVAAGALIVQEAGSVVTDFKGGDDWLFGESIVAGSPQIHQGLLQLLIKHFGS
ncbi:MAG TPA: inositol monophosphatase family protein [Chitinophagales bacterium]|nr:inositol monophosphatase family protein [Chitinophagales bacterium]